MDKLVRNYRRVCFGRRVGVQNYSSESRSLVALFLVAFMVTVVLWVVFYVAGEKTRAKVAGAKHEQVIVDLLTMTGTFLAITTIMGILFFIYIAPRVQ